MIIKSLSWKHFQPKRLLQYIQSSSQEEGLYWNILMPDIDKAIEAFKENDAYLNIRKNSNRLIHEIISFSPEDKQHLNREKILELAEKYLELRAPKNIAFGQLHQDKDHFHLHLCISPNEYKSSKVSHFSMKQFMDLRYQLERYQQSRFPELSKSVVYLSKRQVEKDTLEESITARILNLFENSASKDEFIDRLILEDIEVYHQRGKPKGVLIEGKKFTFNRLGISSDLWKQKEQQENDLLNQRKQELENLMDSISITPER